MLIGPFCLALKVFSLVFQDQSWFFFGNHIDCGDQANYLVSQKAKILIQKKEKNVKKILDLEMDLAQKSKIKVVFFLEVEIASAGA